MATHCFYHSADLDGHCSGAIVKYFVPETILHPINYGDTFPWDEVKPEDTVYMVDFCLQPEEDMERLHNLVDAGLIWIDHHKTSIEAMLKFTKFAPIAGFQAVGTAACVLTWRWFRTDCAPLPVVLLGRYDVWDHSDPRTLPFQYRMRMEDLDPLKSEDAMTLWSGMFERIDEEAFIIDRVAEGSLLLRYSDQENLKYARAYAFETEVAIPPWASEDDPVWQPPLRAICANRGFSNSKLFDSIYDPGKHHIMLTFCRLPPHKQSKGGWTVSLYSTREDVDCGEIARTFGGGGHKGAAGFRCDELPFSVGR